MNRKEFIEYIAKMVVATPSEFFNSITIAQAALESGYGTSTLYKAFNNSFGYKAKKGEWNGKVAGDYKSDEEVNGVLIKDVPSDFRAYDSVLDSVKDHAYMMSRTAWYADYYKDAINAKTPEAQAKALTGKYAGDSKYDAKLMDVINAYGLKKYDDVKAVKEDKGEGSNMAFPKPAMTDRRRQALGYPGHGAYAKRNKSAIKNIVWHYTATTHAGDGMTIIKNHENYWRNTHKWEIGGYHYYIDRQGKIFWNYDLEIVTYGASATNPYTMHISSEASSAGNYTEAQKKSREALTLWLLTNDLKHLNGQSMRGHKEMPGNSTSCPGYSTAQLNAYRNDLDKKLKAGGSTGGGGSKPVPSANSVVWPKYKAPTQPFKALKVGDKVTIRKGQSAWFIPNNPEVGTKPSKDFAGDKDVITKVMDVNVGYSKKAYLLKDKISWILEQDLENSRSEWKETVDAKSHTVKSGEYLFLIGEKYGVTVAQIKEWNRLLTNVIYTGQKLYVEDPSKEAVTPSQPAPDKPIIEAPKDEQPKDNGNETPAVELKDGEFIWGGIKYKIVESTI